MIKQVAYWERKPKSQNVYLVRGNNYVPEIDWLTRGVAFDGFCIAGKYPQLKSEPMLEISTDDFNVIRKEFSRVYDEISKDIKDCLPEQPSVLNDIRPDIVPLGTCYYSETDDALNHHYEIGQIDAVVIEDGRKLFKGSRIWLSRYDVRFYINSTFLLWDHVEEIQAEVFDTILTKWIDTPYYLWNFIEKTCDTLPLPRQLPRLLVPERTDFPGDEEKRRTLPVSCGRGSISWFDHTVRSLTAEEIAYRKDMMQPIGNIECRIGIRTLKNMISSHFWEDVPGSYCDVEEEHDNKAIEREDALAVYDTYTTYLSEITDFVNSILESSVVQVEEVVPQKGSCYWLIEAMSSSEYRFKAIKVKSVSSRAGNILLKGPLVYWENTTNRLGNVMRVNKTQTIITRAIKLRLFPESKFNALFDLVSNSISSIHKRIVSFG